MDYDFVEDYEMSFGFLEGSIGKAIKIERGGPDKLEGTLLGIRPDHLVVQTQDGVVYVCCYHIKTVSEPILAETGQTQENQTAPIVMDADDMPSLMSKMQHKLVKINQGGPNCLEGVLVMQRDDCVTIVHNMQDYVHYPMRHIRSVSCILTSNKDKDKEKQGNDKNKK